MIWNPRGHPQEEQAMPDESGNEYYQRRERAALKLAENAKDPGIRRIHLNMAKEYRRRADETGHAVPAIPRPPVAFAPARDMGPLVK
jgi:hypothetical protein